MTRFSARQRKPRSAKPTRNFRVEHLEDRRMMATLTVNTTADVVDATDDVTSLREAINATNAMPGADHIVFDFGNDDPGTILLNSGQLEITDELTITGECIFNIRFDVFTLN